MNRTAEEWMDVADEDGPSAVARVIEAVRDEIRHGHVHDDVSRVLQLRLSEVGVTMRPEAIDDLADDIETDVSQ